MKRLVVAMFVGLAAASCGAVDDEPLPDPGFARGSRLRPRVFDVEGVRIFREFFDDDLGAVCSFSPPTPSGESACIPDELTKHVEGSGPFADDACTIPAAAVTRFTETKPFARFVPTDPCAAPVFRRLATTPPVTGYTRGGDGRCGRTERPLSVKPLLDEAPLATFVRGTEIHEPRGGRIDARVVVAEDGARVTIGGYDRVRGEAVEDVVLDDGRRVWAPVDVARRSRNPFACEDVAFGVAAPNDYLWDASLPTCRVRAVVVEGRCGRRYLRASPPLASTEVIPRCGYDSAAPGGKPPIAVAIGASIADELEPVVTRPVGSGRFQSFTRSATAGQAVLTNAAFDARLGSECTVQSLSSYPSSTAAPSSALDRAELTCLVRTAALSAADRRCAEAVLGVAEQAECATTGQPGNLVSWKNETYRVTSERVDTVWGFEAPSSGSCFPRPGYGYRLEKVDVPRPVVRLRVD